MTRPKGYAEWRPRPETAATVQDVKRVLAEYQAHLPLTVRQIFYRMVGQYGYEKTEQAYNRLADYIVRARRAQLIPFSSIRDDGTVGSGYAGWDSMEQFVDGIRHSADSYQRERSEGQPVEVELWCEAAGMVPQLQRAVLGLPVSVYSTGGFSSVTVTHEIAQRALRRDRPTAFLHVGDYDPSGESIFEAMGVDAKSFLRTKLWQRLQDDEVLYLGNPVPEGSPDLLLSRVALTADQVDEYELPTAPPKKSDTRSASWVGDTCQAEAMPPDLLAEVIRNACEDQLDLDVLDDLKVVEEKERAALIEYLESFELPEID